MTQQDEKRIEEGFHILEELKEQRGGAVLPFHKKCANVPELLEAFRQQHYNCNKKDTYMPRKYRELILFALGCAKGVETTAAEHAKLAVANGATVEELGEVLRLIFFYCGASALIPSVEIFDELPGSEEL